MKLRTVEMVGFKSFRNRECLEISDGITCIVGPNGCGKSNVVDAIKWAMGDMSPKSLRGDSLSDVIFAGTEKKKPAGMAEVTLTFDNSREAREGRQTVLEGIGDDPTTGGDGTGDVDLGKGIPREFQNLSDIAITRRLHRSGDSEYLINKVPCRLRDIRNLLAGTGLGKQGYSIIEQGQIGFIVNARPSERRLIIEEASGITRYKDRRKRADRKLERTEQNLQRTRDVLDEIESRMESLESQAEKAREHKKITARLESLEIGLLVDRRDEAVSTAENLEDDLKEAREEAEEVQKKLAIAEKNLEKARKEAENADARHDDLTENYYKVETRLNLAKSNREHAEETRKQAADRREELIEERQRQQERQKHLVDERQRVRRELEKLEQRPDDAREQVEELESEVERLEGACGDVTARRDELRGEVERRNARIQRIDDRREWIDEQLDDLDDRRDNIGEELKACRTERDELQQDVSRLIVDHERQLEELETYRSEAAKKEEKLEQLQASLAEAEQREQERARRKMELETRIESLEEMRDRGEGYEQGVQRVVEWANDADRDDIYGPAGDFLQVPAGDEAAYAAFVGDRIGDLVVADRAAALDALSVLDDDEAGRVACMPLPEGIDDPEGLVASWVAKLEIVDGLEDVPDAEEVAEHAGWATSEGDVVLADGRVVGGGTGDRAETVLRRVRELDELRDEYADVDARHREARERAELLAEEVELTREGVESTRKKVQDGEHRARGLDQELEAQRREKERCQKRLDRLVEQADELEGRGEELVEERQSLSDDRAEIAESIPGHRRKIAELETEIADFGEAIEEVEEELTERKIEVAQVDERQRHLQDNIERIDEGLEEATTQIERFGREIDEQKTRRNEARLRAETLADEVERLASDHETLAEEVEEAGDALEELNEQVEALELSVLGRRQDVDEAKEAVQELEMVLREAELEVEHATEQLEERFELDWDRAEQIAGKLEVPADERKQKVDSLKRRLRKIGEVNALAIEEFEESKERYRFHAEQQQDLEESVADLRAAIERMDRESRKRFGETFEAVNENFREVFPRLFQGGKAQLILTEPDDLLETGVDIEVQPPGKKLQNVSLLSGGEKALTAVSLIFAIFVLKPSPFAILDEVDAPLDDVNVGRFAEMVGELSRTSQMILITHNRRTMETPDRLYGVTMEEAGVSKLVSLDLSEVDDRLAS